MTKIRFVMLLLLVFVPALSGKGEAQTQERRLVGSGSLAVTKQSRNATAVAASIARSTTTPQWSVDATIHSDRHVTGTVQLAAGDKTMAGELSGHTDGRHVWGDVLDSSGHQVATFHGVLGPNGLEGKFTTQDDDEGTWRWEGALPGQQ